MRMRFGICLRVRVIQSAILFPRELVIHAMRMLVGLGFDQRPLRQIDVLRVAQIIFCAPHRLIFAERSARSIFTQNVMHGMQRAVRTQHHREFFRLAVAKISNFPKRPRHFLIVNFVHSGHTDALAQEFVRHRIGGIGEQHRVMIRPRVDPAVAKNFIGTGERRPRINRKLQVIADSRLFEAPRQQTPNHQARRKNANQARRKRVVYARLS